MRDRTLHQMIRQLMIAAASIPIVVLGIYAYSSMASDFTEGVGITATQAAATMKMVTREFDERNRSYIRIFAEHPDVRVSIQTEPNEEKIMTAINIFDNNALGVSSISLALEDGRVFSGNLDKLPKESDPRARPWYRKAVENPGQVVVTEPFESPSRPGTYDLTYALAVADPITGKTSGVVGSDVNLSSLETMISNIRISGNGSVLVADASGRVLMGQHDLLKYELSKNPGVMTEILNHGNSGERLRLFGNPYKTNVLQSPNTGWYIVTLIPEAKLIEGRKNILIVVGITILLMLTAAWVLAKIAERHLTAPIDLLNKQIASLQLTEEPEMIELHWSVPQEIKVIKESLNTMIDRIQGQGKYLLDQKQEINSQYMEINALYEETSALNDSLYDMVDQLKNSNRQTIRVLSNAIEANDHYTNGHCERVMEFALELGRCVGFDSGQLEDLELASLLHDVGKVGIPTHILNKEGRLTAEEFEIVKRHPELGIKIVESIPFLVNASISILQHHERFDGKGYPAGIKGENISLSARILCIADVYDAMTSARPYRKTPLSREEALDVLMDGGGKQFDPELVSVFKDILMDRSIMIR